MNGLSVGFPDLDKSSHFIHKPIVQRLRDELTAVVYLYGFRTTPRSSLIRLNNRPPRQSLSSSGRPRSPDIRGYGVARSAPSFLSVRGYLTSARSFASSVQAFFSINAVSPIVIVSPALAPHQDLNPRETRSRVSAISLIRWLTARSSRLRITKHQPRQCTTAQVRRSGTL